MMTVDRPRRVTMRDPDLPHQIVVVLAQARLIVVSCNCLAVRHPNGSVAYEPLDARTLWQPGEAVALWRGHLADVRRGHTGALREFLASQPRRCPECGTDMTIAADGTWYCPLCAVTS